MVLPFPMIWNRYRDSSLCFLTIESCPIDNKRQKDTGFVQFYHRFEAVYASLNNCQVQFYLEIIRKK